MSCPFKPSALARPSISGYQNTLVHAIDGIRFMAKDYWNVISIIPSLEGDYGAFLKYVDLNQQAIALWLECYLLNNVDAARLCKSDSFVSATKREADLHLSWFKLARQIVAAPKFDEAVKTCIQRNLNMPLHDPAFWMVWAASAYFETKMKNSGFHQFLKNKPVRARVSGARKRYQKAARTFKESTLSTHTDFVQGRKEGSGLDALYQIASWLNQHDSAFGDGNYFTTAMNEWRRYNEQGYRVGAKALYLGKPGNLNIQGRGNIQGKS